MTTNLKTLEKISKALGDVSRLKILDHIAANGGTGHCSALQDCVDLAQPSISHHIRILTEAGLIEAEKEGRHYKYILNQEVLRNYLEEMAKQVLPGSRSSHNDGLNGSKAEKPAPIVIPPTAGPDAQELPAPERPGKVTHG